MEFKKEIRGDVEYRTDPLTGEQSRINPQRAKRVKQAEKETEVTQIIEESRQRCSFCPEHIEEATPCFPENVYEDGRIRVGESVLFPNMDPFGENHAVGTLTTAHHVNLDQFSEQIIADNLRASIKYMLLVNAKDPEAVYPTYVWNFMPPSAGSIVHPHVQLMVERKPLPGQQKLQDRSRLYLNRKYEIYWEQLLEEEERQGDRFIARNGSLTVLASFAPRGFREVQFIFSNASSLTDLTEDQVSDFADYVVRLLKAYKAMGVGSFNLVTYSAAIGQELRHYWLSARIISRPFPKGVYTNDTGPLERLYDVWVVDTLPEDVAEAVRPFFQ